MIEQLEKGGAAILAYLICPNQPEIYYMEPNILNLNPIFECGTSKTIKGESDPYVHIKHIQLVTNQTKLKVKTLQSFNQLSNKYTERIKSIMICSFHKL